MDWVIVGGESGHGARPMEAEWVRSLRNQCREESVPFFFKQWGGSLKSRAGRLLDSQSLGRDAASSRGHSHWSETGFGPYWSRGRNRGGVGSRPRSQPNAATGEPTDGGVR